VILAERGIWAKAADGNGSGAVDVINYSGYYLPLFTSIDYLNTKFLTIW
jgi:hypothetical protein